MNSLISNILMGNLSIIGENQVVSLLGNLYGDLLFIYKK